MNPLTLFVKTAYAADPPSDFSLGHPLPGLKTLVGVSGTGSVLGDLISKIVAMITYIAGIMLLLYLVYGGFKYVSAGGDEKAIKEAKTMLTNAIVGLVIVVAAILITQIIGGILGFQNILQPVFRGPGS